MTNSTDQAMDRMPVAPDPAAEEQANAGRSDAGQDKSIERRLEKHPDSKDARLDRGLDESMDASDPPAATQPVNSQEPPASSGYDPEAEAKLQGSDKA